MQINLQHVPKTSYVDLEVLYDTVIVGGGPAGFNAALYAKRKGLKTLLITHDVGGQLENTSIVDNYLGFHTIDANDLTKAFLDHVKSLEVPIITEQYIRKIEKKDGIFYLSMANFDMVQSKTVVIATGGSHKKLGIKGEDEFANKGVSYCAICDAPFYKDKHVLVAGGGNSAVEAAIDLSKWATKVTIVQRSVLRADKILIDKMNEIDNISVILQTSIKEIIGSITMEGVKTINNQTLEEGYIEADGLFVEIGTLPNSLLVKDLVELNGYGEIIVNSNQETSLEGMYAAGDVTNEPFKQIIIAASAGAKAVLSLDQYLKTKK
jgi:thioredoxin-disulfide reductase